MRQRFYHLGLDLTPEWGSVLGFGMDGCVLEWIQAPDWWQMMLVSYGGILTVDGTPTPFWSRSLLIVPPRSRCRLERTNGDNITQHWLKFRPNAYCPSTVALPQVHEFGAEYEHLDHQFRTCLDNLMHSRVRLDVMGWNLLWSISGNVAALPEDPIVAQAHALVREWIDRPLSVERLAQEVGISASRLAVIYREAYGQPLMDHVRTLRMEQACSLLVNTDCPVKEVAARVGIPDLQRFNKVIRETFGCSPRSLRTHRPAVSPHLHDEDARIQRQTFRRAETPHLNGSPDHSEPGTWEEA